ncbi:MAG: hypothetical protein Q7W13_13210 [Bacteroidia bacterium]|nr:hypothetical protein [Bacteroidia bacterium]
MKKRENLEAKIAANIEKITSLNIEIIELRKKTLLLSDDVQWFKEKKETIGRGKTKKEVLVGRIHWKEDFKDENNGEVITIERQRVVRVDGKWQ